MVWRSLPPRWCLRRCCRSGGWDVLDNGVALWVAVAQLIELGAYVGHAASLGGLATWTYAAVTGSIGVAVVILKLLLGH